MKKVFLLLLTMLTFQFPLVAMRYLGVIGKSNILPRIVPILVVSERTLLPCMPRIVQPLPTMHARTLIVDQMTPEILQYQLACSWKIRDDKTNNVTGKFYHMIESSAYQELITNKEWEKVGEKLKRDGLKFLVNNRDYQVADIALAIQRVLQRLKMATDSQVTFSGNYNEMDMEGYNRSVCIAAKVSSALYGVGNPHSLGKIKERFDQRIDKLKDRCDGVDECSKNGECPKLAKKYLNDYINYTVKT